MNKGDERPFEFRGGDARLIVDMRCEFSLGGAPPIESSDEEALKDMPLPAS